MTQPESELPPNQPTPASPPSDDPPTAPSLSVEGPQNSPQSPLQSGYAPPQAPPDAEAYQTAPPPSPPVYPQQPPPYPYPPQNPPGYPPSGYAPEGYAPQPMPPQGAPGGPHPGMAGIQQAGAQQFEQLREEFRQVPLRQVLPLAAWWQDKPWKEVWVRWFLLYALFPFVLMLLYHNDPEGLVKAAWGFGTYFALVWLVVLYRCMKPGEPDYRLLGTVAVFTAFVGIALVLALQQLPFIASLYGGLKSGDFVAKYAGFLLGVGPLEEGAKLLPVFLFVYRPKVPASPLMYAFVGVVSGLAFGVAEAVKYSVVYAQGAAQGTLVAGAAILGPYIMVQFLRLITLPLLHACWCAISGYFLGLSTLHPRAGRALVLTGLGIAIVLHGNYDVFASEASGWTGFVIAAVSLFIFVSYVRTGETISQALAAVGAMPPQYDPAYGQYPAQAHAPPYPGHPYPAQPYPTQGQYPAQPAYPAYTPAPIAEQYPNQASYPAPAAYPPATQTAPLAPESDAPPHPYGQTPMAPPSLHITQPIPPPEDQTPR